MALNLSECMRLDLARVGISLDDSKPSIARPPAPRGSPVVDRELVRAELTARGATPEQLEWLVPSCPSHEAARAFRPIRKL